MACVQLGEFFASGKGDVEKTRSLRESSSVGTRSVCWAVVTPLPSLAQAAAGDGQKPLCLLGLPLPPAFGEREGEHSARGKRTVRGAGYRAVFFQGTQIRLVRWEQQPGVKRSQHFQSNCCLSFLVRESGSRGVSASLLGVVLSAASVSDSEATANGTVTDRAGVVLNLHHVVLLGCVVRLVGVFGLFLCFLCQAFRLREEFGWVELTFTFLFPESAAEEHRGRV